MNQRTTFQRLIGGLPAWAATWFSILFSTFIAVIVLAHLSTEGARSALETALADHLGAQAGEADGALHTLPIELILAMGGERSAQDLREQIDNLSQHAGLRGIALIGPNDQIIGHQGTWIPAAAETDLIAKARNGATTTGPLYHDHNGELYQTAYRPLTEHPGWVVAVEGSAATLGAVDHLEQTLWTTGTVVVVLAAIVGTLLATLVSRPLQRLGHELATARPGSPPETVGSYGFREVRQVSAAARELLSAIRNRDQALHSAHHREITQLTRMAAEIAHEVGNPLNAISLSIERLRHVDDRERRIKVLDRIQGQLTEMEAIVEGLRDVTRPLHPNPQRIALSDAIDAATVEGLSVRCTSQDTVLSDRGMLIQILRNLMMNAHQAGAKRVDIHVKTTHDQLELQITDDGPGLTETQSAQIFDWFHTTRAQGSGLGLPVSRRIAEALGGELQLIAHHPATFQLSLPREPHV